MSRQYPAGRLPDEREAKLPKWAQQELVHLRRREEELMARIETRAGSADTNVWVRANAGANMGLEPVGRDEQVIFALPGSSGPQPNNYVEVRLLSDGALNVRYAHGTIVLRPRVSNSVDIVPVP